MKQPAYHDLRIFNNYGWGGFLIKTWPEKELFIDGRVPIMEVNGQSFLEEYYDFFTQEKVESKLNEYHSWSVEG